MAANLNPRADTGSPVDRETAGYPEPDAARDVHETQDLQRATDAYRFFYPTVSMECFLQGLRDAGFADGSVIALLTAQPHHRILTASSDTPSSVTVLDLSESGPVAVEIPSGSYVGLLNDHHHRWIADLGVSEPDFAHGCRYLILPPDYAGPVPLGYRVLRCGTHKALLTLRALPLEGSASQALAELQRVKVYPLTRPRDLLPYVDITARRIDTTPLRFENGLEYWRRLHRVLESEPTPEEFRPMQGLLASLGVRRGQPFVPTPRMQRILELAAHSGNAQMRVEAFASNRGERKVWIDRSWEWLGLVQDPNFEASDYLDVQARDRWFFQALCASKASLSHADGAGSICLLTTHDATGEYLDGGRNYVLQIPAPVPARLFWSVTAYDARTRSQVLAPGHRAAFSSLDRPDLEGTNENLELYFGPDRVEGREAQWIQTAHDTYFFVYFRIYGPEFEAFDGSWRLGDLTPLAPKTPARAPYSGKTPGTRASISTPDIVDSRIGRLRFSDGIPDADTVARVYDTLDHMHAVEAFLNFYHVASLGAIRAGLQAAGVDDNEVLLFSELIDSRSLLLTADCDVITFICCLDVSNGPIVLEVPPGVFGAVHDMWFELITDFGTAGIDQYPHGRYLVVPKHYDGPRPIGFVSCQARTDHAILFGRAFFRNDDTAAAARRVREHVRIYPYSPFEHHSRESHGSSSTAVHATPFIEGTGMELQTIPPNDESYYELVHSIVEAEPAESLDIELAGQLAAIGISKGKPFAPDARMRKILREAVALANATARTLSMRARALDAFRYYEPTSAWLNPSFASGLPLAGGGAGNTTESDAFVQSTLRTLNVRTRTFYMALGSSLAMYERVTSTRTQALAAMWDSDGDHFDGSKTYELILPRDIPAELLWSLTVYYNQTRSMLATEQRFPRVGSQNVPTPAAVHDADGATHIFFGPDAPRTAPASNWIRTVPTRGWFAILRLYGPLPRFFDKTWRPSEIVRVPEPFERISHENQIEPDLVSDQHAHVDERALSQAQASGNAQRRR